MAQPGKMIDFIKGKAGEAASTVFKKVVGETANAQDPQYDSRYTGLGLSFFDKKDKKWKIRIGIIDRKLEKVILVVDPLNKNEVNNLPEYLRNVPEVITDGMQNFIHKFKDPNIFSRKDASGNYTYVSSSADGRLPDATKMNRENFSSDWWDEFDKKVMGY